MHSQCAELLGVTGSCTNAEVCQFGSTALVRNSDDLPVEGWACELKIDPRIHLSGNLLSGGPSVIEPATLYSPAEGTPNAVCSAQSQAWIKFVGDYHSLHPPSGNVSQRRNDFASMTEAWTQTRT